ncbi:four-helix bundle copper-binding protein [Salibacterium salarium]|uniref:four-helix bundle copper-binding protein n=1 Tax=Salibacterium salarium TaxID=284579 RepID=UPI0032B1D7DB
MANVVDSSVQQFQTCIDACNKCMQACEECLTIQTMCRRSLYKHVEGLSRYLYNGILVDVPW